MPRRNVLKKSAVEGQHRNPRMYVEPTSLEKQELKSPSRAATLKRDHP